MWNDRKRKKHYIALQHELTQKRVEMCIRDSMKEADILKLQKKLNQEPFVKQSEYISKKQALKEQTLSLIHIL